MNNIYSTSKFAKITSFLLLISFVLMLVSLGWSIYKFGYIAKYFVKGENTITGKVTNVDTETIEMEIVLPTENKQLSLKYNDESKMNIAPDFKEEKLDSSKIKVKDIINVRYKYTYKEQTILSLMDLGAQDQIITYVKGKITNKSDTKFIVKTFEILPQILVFDFNDTMKIYDQTNSAKPEIKKTQIKINDDVNVEYNQIGQIKTIKNIYLVKIGPTAK